MDNWQRRDVLKSGAAFGAGTLALTTTTSVQAEPGDEQWSFETGNHVYSSPTVVDGTVFVGSWDHNLYAVDAATGEQQWAFQTGDRVWSSPTVVNGTVFVGSYDNTIYAVDAASGEQEWAFETGQSLESSPTVVDGTVFIGSDNLYAVDAATGEQQSVDHIGGRVILSDGGESDRTGREAFSKRARERNLRDEPSLSAADCRRRDSVATHDRCPNRWTATGRTGRRVTGSLEQPCAHRALSRRPAAPSHRTP